MGVFENVEVLGRSGADLETELLHHEMGGSNDLEQSPGDDAASPGDEKQAGELDD